MRRLFASLLAIALFSLPAHAQKGHHSASGSHSHSSRTYSARPYYGGGSHSSSHGGQYPGAHGSAHKGGHYVNPKTGNRYGTHKS